jgi:hypothetical protein
MSKTGDIMSRGLQGSMIDGDAKVMSQELDMFAAVKLIVVLGIACGTLVASIVETPYPRFAVIFWIAFGLGIYVAECLRARRQRSVRYLRKPMPAKSVAYGLASD